MRLSPFAIIIKPSAPLCGQGHPLALALGRLRRFGSACCAVENRAAAPSSHIFPHSCALLHPAPHTRKHTNNTHDTRAHPS